MSTIAISVHEIIIFCIMYQSLPSSLTQLGTYAKRDVDSVIFYVPGVESYDMRKRIRDHIQRKHGLRSLCWLVHGQM